MHVKLVILFSILIFSIPLAQNSFATHSIDFEPPVFIPNPTPNTADCFACAFGYHAIGMNGNIIVIGDLNDQSTGSQIGAAYFYDADLNLDVSIINPAPTVSGAFGSSVAVGNNHVVVGAKDSAGVASSQREGRAYVFDTSGNSLHTLSHPNPYVGTDNFFGISTGISGNDILVGALFDSNRISVSSGIGVGAANLFDATTGNHIRTFSNPADESTAFEQIHTHNFAHSVSIFGDHVVAGAPSVGVGSNNRAGATYVFDKNSGVLQHTFLNPSPVQDGEFGLSTAVSNNFVLIGAPAGENTSPPSEPGKAYLFNVSTGNLVHTFNSPNPVNQGRFGFSVSLNENSALIGAPGEGKAYLFDLNTGNLIHTFDNPNLNSDILFGFSVVILEDAVISSRQTFGNPNGLGSAYFFKAITTGGGSGGGGSDQQWKTKPTFGVNHQTNVQQVEGGFTVNYKSFDITDNWHTNLGKQTILVGQPNTFTAKAYSGPGLQLVKFMFGIPEVGKSYEAEASVEVWLNRNLEVTAISIEQKDNLINEETIFALAEKANCTDSDTQNRCDIVLVSVSFNEAPLYDIFALEGMDIDRRNQITYLNEGIHVEGNSLNPSKILMVATGEKPGLTLLVQIDKRHDIWVDGSGIQYQKNQFGTFLRITPEQFNRYDDPASNVMTRLHSDFDLIKQYELNRATKMFDSSLIQKDISESFSFIIPEKLNKLDDPEVQAKMLQENLRAREKLIELWNYWYPVTRQISD